MEPKDWTLLVLSEAGSKPLEPVQLQKILFLIGKNLPMSELRTERFYDFRAYDYGPFCRDVYDDAEALDGEGLATISRRTGSRLRLFSATPAGHERAQTLRAGLSQSAGSYLERVVDFAQRLSFDQLVRAVYTAYPEMKANSVFQGR